MRIPDKRVDPSWFEDGQFHVGDIIAHKNQRYPFYVREESREKGYREMQLEDCYSGHRHWETSLHNYKRVSLLLMEALLAQPETEEDEAWRWFVNAL